MSRAPVRLRQILRLTSPEKFLLAALIPFGILGALLIPIGAGHDEESQMARVWEMSAFHFIPNEKLGTPEFPYPTLLRDVSYRQQLLVRPVPPDFWSKYAGLRVDAEGYYYGPMMTRIVYSPPLLLPQALTMRYLGRRFDLPFLEVYYATRLAGLAAYIFLAWLAVRLIPFGKWTMAVVAASPLALFQASTVNADAISNGLGIFFIGGSLAIALKTNLRRRDLAALIFLAAALFLGKLNVVGLAVLPFLFVRPSSFRFRAGYWLLLSGVAVLLAIEVAGWGLIAYPGVQPAMLPGANPPEQAMYVLRDPLRFVSLIAVDLGRNAPAYLQAWIAGYGYGYWEVPAFTYVLFVAALVASLFVPTDTPEPTRRTRWALLATAAMAYAITAVAFYVAFTPARSLELFGMNGRYLFAALTPLPLALVGLRGAALRPWAWIAGGCSALGLASFLGGAALSYYVTCGTQVYQPGLCFLPYYKNWAPNDRLSPPLDSSIELTQEIVPECNGLAGVRVWVEAQQSAGDGATEFILRDPAADVNLVERVIPNDRLPQDGWQTFEFPAQEGSVERLYLLRLRGLAPDGVQVGYTLKPENTTMKLFENGNLSNVDLFFQYGCLTGLEKVTRSVFPGGLPASR